MMLFLLTILCHIIVHHAENISLQTSSIHLPTPLTYPITAIYQNTLFMMPSNITNKLYSSPLTSGILQNINNTLYYTTIDVSQPSFWPHTISCGNNNNGFYSKCYAVKNEFLYIMQYTLNPQRYQDILYLLIYDMNQNTFVPSSTYNYIQSVYYYGMSAWFEFVPICVYFVDNELMIMGTSYNSKLFGHSYNILTGVWANPSWSISTIRDGIGCEHVDNYVYLFGGDLNGVQVGYGEKCSDSSGDCDYLAESMQYFRSHFHVTLILSEYLLIYGGSTQDAKDNIEIFDTTTDSFIRTLPNGLNSLHIEAFTPLTLSSSILTFIGGISSTDNQYINTVQYMDFSRLFDTDEVDLPSCVLTYENDDNLWCSTSQSIHQNLLQGVDELVFDVIVDDNSNCFKINIKSANNAASLPIGFERNGDVLEVEAQVDVGFGVSSKLFFVDLQNVTNETGINMMNNHYVLWMKWGIEWDIGFGDVVGENSLLFWMHPSELDECKYLGSGSDRVSCMSFIWPQLVIIAVVAMDVGAARFVFQHDACSLNLNMDNSQRFIVGDSLDLLSNHTLTAATSLSYPIYLRSDTIMGLDHVMTIMDSPQNISVCTLCKMTEPSSCYDCNQGIQIMDLQTYDITDNSYEISISSKFESLSPKTIILQRKVQEIEFYVGLSNESTFGIYPESEIFIIPKYNEAEPVQPNGTFMISFDPDLSLGFDHQSMIFIDFHHDLCELTYNGNTTINCNEDAITVPKTMEFKDIDYNSYYLEVHSLDTNITKQTRFEFPRRIQTLSVDFSDEIHLGHVINIFVEIADDDEILQQESNIIVSSDTYNIYSEIQVTYSLDIDANATNGIVSCIVYSPIYDTTTGCDEGIPFRSTDTDIIDKYIYLNISSPDTYIEKDYHMINVHKLYITQCDIGSKLIGSSLTSFACVSCSIGSVGLVKNSKCFDCSNTKGIQCLGVSNLIISYNYWVVVSDDGNITSNFCPSGYCCENVNGCNYTDTMKSTYGICAYGRDPTAPLCGKCTAGYSESFGSSNCQKCEENKYELLLIPMVFALLLVFLLLIFDPPPKKKTAAQNATKLQLLKDDFKAIQLCLLRPLLYFAQALRFITIQHGLYFYLAPLIRILSLDLFESYTWDEDESEGICFVNGLTSFGKQLWSLFFPMCMFVSIGFYALIHLCVKHGCKKQVRFLSFGVNVIMTLFILLVGNIISTMLELLACSKLSDDEFVHFYSGDESCFGGMWFFAFVSVMIIIIFWIAMWFKLKNMSEKERESRDSVLRTVTKSYKSSQWSHEFVLLSRRILVPLLVTMQYMDDSITQYILSALIVLYLVYHCVYYPFKYNRANRLEIVCLLCLFFSLSIIIFEFHIEHPKTVSLIMTILVILPILFVSYYAISLMVNCIKSSEKQSERVKKWKARLSPSQKNVLQTDGLETVEESAADAGGQVNQTKNKPPSNTQEIELQIPDGEKSDDGNDNDKTSKTKVKQ